VILVPWDIVFNDVIVNGFDLLLDSHPSGIFESPIIISKFSDLINNPFYETFFIQFNVAFSCQV